MKKMEMPEMKFVELAAGDVIATSDMCNPVCDPDCENYDGGECYMVCYEYGSSSGYYFCEGNMY